MRIDCPKCGRAGNLPEGKNLKSVTLVRCPKCKHPFRPRPAIENGLAVHDIPMMTVNDSMGDEPPIMITHVSVAAPKVYIVGKRKTFLSRCVAAGAALFLIGLFVSANAADVSSTQHNIGTNICGIGLMVLFAAVPFALIDAIFG